MYLIPIMMRCNPFHQLRHEFKKEFSWESVERWWPTFLNYILYLKGCVIVAIRIKLLKTFKVFRTWSNIILQCRKNTNSFSFEFILIIFIIRLSHFFTESNLIHHTTKIPSWCFSCFHVFSGATHVSISSYGLF